MQLSQKVLSIRVHLGKKKPTDRLNSQVNFLKISPLSWKRSSPEMWALPDPTPSYGPSYQELTIQDLMHYSLPFFRRGTNAVFMVVSFAVVRGHSNKDYLLQQTSIFLVTCILCGFTSSGKNEPVPQKITNKPNPTFVSFFT